VYTDGSLSYFISRRYITPARGAASLLLEWSFLYIDIRVYVYVRGWMGPRKEIGPRFALASAGTVTTVDD